MDLDKKYGSYRSVHQEMVVQKAAKKYDKSAAKDIRRAIKKGDVTSANNVSAGRTYMKMLTDSNFLNQALSDAAAQAKVKPGKDFTYNVLRDLEKGGVTITVNNKASTYVYSQEYKR